jgi:hypothetical protein
LALPQSDPRRGRSLAPSGREAFVSVASSGTHQVASIDSRAPDIRNLPGVLEPRAQAFAHDPSSGGSRHIVNILAANELIGLSSISFVGHGAARRIDLGATNLASQRQRKFFNAA